MVLIYGYAAGLPPIAPTVMPLSALLLSLLAAGCCYLASPHRRWACGPVRYWNGMAVVLVAAGFATWIAALGPVAGVFACVTTLMSGWMLMPWLGLLRPIPSPNGAATRVRGNAAQEQERTGGAVD